MNEFLVGIEAICKKFHISRARLKRWEEAGAPIYRRGLTHNAACCADYHRLLDWESGIYTSDGKGLEKTTEPPARALCLSNCTCRQSGKRNCSE